MKERSFRNEILLASHRWPVIILYCLLGAFIGWCIAQVLPSPYSSEAELYIGLDINHWTEDKNILNFTNGVTFNYPDDYKNWQMANLDLFVTRDDVLKETLDRLRRQDPYWLGTNRNQLGRMFHVYWRNVGKWRLVAEHSDPKRAKQAVSVWRDVVVERVQTALSHSQDTLYLDKQLQDTSASLSQAETRLSRLSTAAAQLPSLKGPLSELPNNEPVPELMRWSLWSWGASIANLDPLWNELLNSFPQEGLPPQAYLDWLVKAETALDQDRRLASGEIVDHQRKYGELSTAFKRASEGSYGLSPNLQIEPVSINIPPPIVLRPTGQIVLTGMLIGLFIWILLWLGRITILLVK